MVKSTQRRSSTFEAILLTLGWSAGAFTKPCLASPLAPIVCTGALRQALASENSYHPELATLLEILSLKSVNLFLLDKETRLWCVYISIVEVYCRNHE